MLSAGLTGVFVVRSALIGCHVPTLWGRLVVVVSEVFDHAAHGRVFDLREHALQAFDVEAITATLMIFWHWVASLT